MPTDVPPPPGADRPVSAVAHVTAPPTTSPSRLPGVTGRRRLGPGGGWLLGARVVLGLAAAITVMAAALFVGMRLDDRQIDQHRGTATATVLSISVLHTGIEFVDASGVTIRPPTGVLYPGLLTVGQRFQVEYSTLDPKVVRVAGRTAAVGNPVLALTVVVTWLIALPSAWWLRRRYRARAGVLTPAGSAPGPAPAPPGR